MEAQIKILGRKPALTLSPSLGNNSADDYGQIHSKVTKESNRCYSGSGFSETSVPQYHHNLPKEAEENTVWELSTNLDLFNHSPDLPPSLSLTGCSCKSRKSLHSDSVFATAEILTMMKYLPRFPPAEATVEKPLGFLSAPKIKLFNSSHPKKIRTNLKRKSRSASDFGRIEKFRNRKAEELKQENNNFP
ncbi:hypothetical protein Nepgr_018885 [Nepenthes gracilis]|uniref:Uncharacterized protein n=1 Tax=Nepenthes gracilis TaxID=150966 RepID=A0AAD3SUN6_NEPGR|nr:hypothetical protein Nepgr_018885 [Nepenthes gracilis]